MEASLLKAIRRDLYELADKGENISSYRKEIDHALERIAAIEKHVGIKRSSPRNPTAMSRLRGRPWAIERSNVPPGRGSEPLSSERFGAEPRCADLARFA